MLSVTNAFAVLGIIDEIEEMGLDVMSAGVALAWATEATEKGIISDRDTIVSLNYLNALKSVYAEKINDMLEV